MCKTPEIRAGAGAPPEGIPAADDVQIAERGGLRVSRSNLVNGFGFKRASPGMFSQDTLGEALSSRFGFPT